jgi:hypothetical protein
MIEVDILTVEHSNFARKGRQWVSSFFGRIQKEKIARMSCLAVLDIDKLKVTFTASMMCKVLSARETSWDLQSPVSDKAAHRGWCWGGE